MCNEYAASTSYRVKPHPTDDDTESTEKKFFKTKSYRISALFISV